MESGTEQAARVLLAWLSDEQAGQVLAGSAGAFSAAAEKRLANARQALRDRPAGIDQADIIRPLPAAFGDYVARLAAGPSAAGQFAEGWRPVLADLSRLCAIPPSVHLDQAEQRASGADPGDLAGLAELTLPLAEAPRIIPQFDQERLTFTTNLATQNLHVIGAFGGPAAEADELPPGTVSVGFHLRVITSFVQVASFGGRWFLRDGYHRCLGLLRRGVRYAPVLASQDLPLAELMPRGSLPFETITGDRPPVLPDYWDEQVACEADQPVTRKVIIVRAAELSVTEPAQGSAATSSLTGLRRPV